MKYVERLRSQICINKIVIINKLRHQHDGQFSSLIQDEPK